MPIIRSLFAFIRLLGLLLLIIFGLVVGMFAFLIPARFYLKLARVWHSCVTWLVGLKCCFHGEPFKPGALVVSNHVSWADISVMGSKFPVTFLAKSEIRGWPMLGWMISKAGTIFITRGQGANKAIQDLSDALRRGMSVLIFPEGKTSDGRSVARFQPRLFQSAIDSGSQIQAAAIRYRDQNGRPAEQISYAGSVTLLQSLWRVLAGPRIHVEIRLFTPVLASSDREKLSQDAECSSRSWVEEC